MLDFRESFHANPGLSSKLFRMTLKLCITSSSRDINTIIHHLFPVDVTYIYTSSLLAKKTNKSQILTQWNDAVIVLL